MKSIQQQFKDNLVAIISLTVAVAGLSYNTWRNETTEEHRNIRAAAFEVLGELGELQEVVSYMSYYHTREEMPEDHGRLRIQGYGTALRIRDLMNLMPAPGPDAGLSLYSLWNSSVNDLGSGAGSDPAVSAERRLTGSIDETRSAVVEVLASLD